MEFISAPWGIRRRPTSNFQNVITALAGIIALTIAVTTPNQTALRIKDYLGRISMQATGSGSLTMSGTLRLGALNCTGYANGGDLTTDAFGNVSCSDDDGGSGGGGVTFSDGDARYLRKSGGTLTGVTTVDITGGTQGTVGLKILQTLSGAHIHAEQFLTSSGSLAIEGGVTFASLSSCSLLYSNTNGGLQCLSAVASASGKVLVSRGTNPPVFEYRKEYERFTLYGANSKIRRGSGANFMAAFSGAIVEVQALQRLAMSGVTVHMYVNGQRIFTTALTTDNREVGSNTAAIPAVIDNTKNRFSKYDTLRFDVSGTGSISGTGLTLLIYSQVTAP